MTRAHRLLKLLQILYRRRYPIQGQVLAEKLGISLRTLYRDIATLQEQGAEIKGEAGKGYKLKAGLTLPPLMFTQEEVEALVVGCRWVVRQTDPHLSQAAQQALSEIVASLPETLQTEISSSLLIGYPQLAESHHDKLTLIRHAMSKGVKLAINYCDLKGQLSSRIIWPFAVGFFNHTLVICAWCELRDEFRHFRIDHIQTLTDLDQIYPRPRTELMAAWHHHFNIPVQDLF